VIETPGFLAMGTLAAGRRAASITVIAHMMLGGSKPALSFLNKAETSFGPSPMELARESEEGWVRVKRSIYDFANRPSLLPPMSSQPAQ
jgi:hypothetical protein